MIKAFKYADKKAPHGYYCSKCDKGGCKLWRQYQTCADSIELLCLECAQVDQNKKLDWDKGDQLGWLVPAIPTEDGLTFWGYTSVPSPGVSWWWALPPNVKDVPVVEPPPLVEFHCEKCKKTEKFDLHSNPATRHVCPMDVEYIVRANHNEKNNLWVRYHDALNDKDMNPLAWDSLNGFMCQIGEGRGIDGKKMPVCVQVMFDRIGVNKDPRGPSGGGHLVAFYYGTSQLVDHAAMDDWVHKEFPNAKGTSDAMNFHNCLIGIGVKASLHRCENCGTYTGRLP